MSRGVRRIIVLVADDTDADQDLNSVLTYAVQPPWQPVPPGENAGTWVQERWDQASTDAYLLAVLKRCAAKLHWVSSTIVPDPSPETEEPE
jgi:hypothetical protein